jgi:hypothetical protein
MKTLIKALCLAAVLAAAGCTLPEPKGPARVCIPDSAICYFPDA